MTHTYQTVRIVLADDHEIFRDGFRVMLKKQSSIELVGEAENGVELLQLVDRLQPDVVVTDIKMPLMDGLEATKQLVKKYPEIGIIALSMFDEENMIVEMLEAGARGYLLKNAHKNEIMEAVHDVHQKKNYYCNQTSSRLVSMIAHSNHHPRKAVKPDFNEKEIEIIRLICEQFSNKEIADRLFLSVRTIEGYRERIQEKIEARNMVGIVVYAIRHGIYKI